MNPARDPSAPAAQIRRLNDAWHLLTPERRLAAIASIGLFASMFLHWYSKTETVVVHGAAKVTETSLSAFQAFSFVEAAVLLVSAGVLTMLFARAEGRAFQLPGGDGLIVMIAGAWASVLVFYRLLDKPGLQASERVTATVGVEWGIFVALLLSLSLLYAGGRMRARERPEPPLLRARDSRPRPSVDPDLAATVVEPLPRPRPRPVPARASAAARERGDRPRYPPAPSASPPEGEQLSFEDHPSRSE